MNTTLFSHTKQQALCPQCGAPLVLRQGKQGLFQGCSRYPACNYLKSLHNEHKVIKTLEEKCPECGAALQIKQGHFGMFIGCSAYPLCHFSVSEQAEDNAAQSHLSCPECRQGELVARRGRQGKTFYGCSRYPACKFTLAAQPYVQPCPECGYAVATLKKQDETVRTFQCANRHCRHIFTET